MKRIVLILTISTLVVSLVFANVGYQVVLAANPPPVQIFYLTLPEEEALTALSTINGDAVAPMYTYFSIAIGFDGTLVYYDQWEDSYAADLANPTSGEIYSSANLDGVQIWGNGLAADGCAPNIDGAPFSCTDLSDFLYAGDIIIPYNQVIVPRVATANSYVLDNFSTQSYSNSDGNTTWSSDWVEMGDFIDVNYRDEFASQAYNLSVGSLTWGTSWTEENDNSNPANGDIFINLGTTYGLQFGDGSTAVGDAIYRTANLSGYTSATLSYSYEGAANEWWGDVVQVQVRNPVGGSGGNNTWTTLASINGSSGMGTGSYDISTYIDSDTQIRFYVSAALESNDEIYLDNVDISLQPGPAGSSPSSGDILITSNALRFSETEPNDSMDRGVDLSAGGDCATLGFTLGQYQIDTSGDLFAVQVSSDGGTNYSTLETFDSPFDAGAKSYGISGYASANTRVRFISIDQLESGEYWTVDNARVDWNCSLPTVFDGGDRIGASSATSMARMVWASGSGTLNAYAHELYPTNVWGTTYESPVGVNTSNAGAMFEYSALSIMANDDNTNVWIDADANGSYETTTSIQEGKSYLVTNIRQGARVQTNDPTNPADPGKPIQVVLLTGDIGSNYESRDMNLLSTAGYGSSYWDPAGVDTVDSGPTRLFVYNPSSNSSIYVTCEIYNAATPTSPTVSTLGPIAARGVVTRDLITGQGAHCYASTSNGTATTDPIFAIGTIDTDGQAWDGSLTLYSDSFLTTEVLVGLGLGRDPTYDGSLNNENGGPLWVTAACSLPTTSTYVYVDWDNNGVADQVDLNGDGDVADTVDGISEATSNLGMLVTRLQSVRLFEPPPDVEFYDQSGARVWSRIVSGNLGDPGCNLAVVWAEDPQRATAGSPGLDVATSVPPYTTGTPTAVVMASFDAIESSGNVELIWETTLESNALGFNLYRATSLDSDRGLLNPELIPSKSLNGLGASYKFIDYETQEGVTYYYWLEFIDSFEKSSFGPIMTASPRIYLPIILKP
jgi:hypothetical protein